MRSKLVVNFRKGIKIESFDFVKFRAVIKDGAGNIITSKNFNISWIKLNNQFPQPQPDQIVIKPYSSHLATGNDYANKLDYLDNSNYFAISVSGRRGTRSVAIYSNVDNLYFENVATNNTNISTFIYNQTSLINPLKIRWIDIPLNKSNCNEITYKVVCNKVVKSVTSPIQKEVNAKEFEFKYLRNQQGKVTVETADGEIASKDFATPIKLLGSKILVDIDFNPLGSEATLRYKRERYARLEYSIDGTNFQRNNKFTNLPVGNYTAYIRDDYNCVVSRPFTVVDKNAKTPYFFVSKTNSLRFALRKEWDYKNTYKTDENTLSCEVLDEVANKDVQRFQTNDIITTQLRTNYDNVKAYIIDNETNTEKEITVTKVKTFLNIKDSRDAVCVCRENSTDLYFFKGNKYDFATGTKIGEYNLNGKKPYWLRTDRTIELVGIGIFKIIKTSYNDGMNAEVVTINYVHPELDVFEKKIKSIYNVHNYNLFEFNTDFSLYENKNVRVKIVATDTKMSDLVLISEELQIKETHKNCVEVIYFNEDNGDINYETGIKHKLRLQAEKITSNGLSEINIHKGDTEVNVTKAEYYEGDIITFAPVSKEIARKIEMALLHSYLTINGVPYRSNDKPSAEQLENSNLYTVKANLIKAGYSYKTMSIMDIEEDGGATIDVPNLINNGQEGFISY